MRAEMVAAYLEYRDTGELSRAVVRGEAPQPTAFHRTGRSKEPVWTKMILDRFAYPEGKVGEAIASELDLARLV
ncbi:MAG: hypothetical protein K2W78_12805 [Xanthobacteraceae bacterium]|nr:hypothetical protein [Xanthobacteraceae bacterium]